MSSPKPNLHQGPMQMGKGKEKEQIPHSEISVGFLLFGVSGDWPMQMRKGKGEGKEKEQIPHSEFSGDSAPRLGHSHFEQLQPMPATVSLSSSGTQRKPPEISANQRKPHSPKPICYQLLFSSY